MIGKKRFKKIDTDNTRHFKDGIVIGIGWAIGVTIGFAIIATLLVLVFNWLGGLPIIGTFFASVIESTLEQLYKRTPIIPVN